MSVFGRQKHENSSRCELTFNKNNLSLALYLLARIDYLKRTFEDIAAFYFRDPAFLVLCLIVNLGLACLTSYTDSL